MTNERRWKQEVSGVYTQSAPTYDHVGPRLFTHFANQLMNRLDISPEAQVLDLATGRGALLFVAAERLKNGGQITGIDLSEGMIQQTKAEIQQRGLNNASIHLMDAENLAFSEGAFDYVVCGFGLFLFPRVDIALAEICRVLKPGGHLGISVPGQFDEQWAWLGVVLRSCFPDDFQVPDSWLASTRFNTLEKLESPIREAGFGDIRSASELYDMVYTTPDEWWAWQWSNFPRIHMQALTSEALNRYQTEAYSGLTKLMKPDGLHQIYNALLVTATKP
jgi:ubiquinone/menaquinone biosynthesis C-methylase UbiE